MKQLSTSGLLLSTGKALNEITSLIAAVTVTSSGIIIGFVVPVCHLEIAPRKPQECLDSILNETTLKYRERENS